ncbi:hypothetical protein PMIN04_004860 [Paraphaeosphaeria minitans]
MQVSPGMRTDSGCELSDPPSDLSDMSEAAASEWLDDVYTPLERAPKDTDVKRSAAVPAKKSGSKTTWRKSKDDIEKDLGESRKSEGGKKSVAMSRVTRKDKKRVNFSDVGSTGSDSVLEGDAGYDGEVGSGADSQEEASQGAVEESGNETEEIRDVESNAGSEEDADQGVIKDSGSETEDVERRDPTGRRKKSLTASPQTRTTSSATAKVTTSNPAATSLGKSVEKLSGQKAIVATFISDDESELSDPDSNPENPNDTNTSKPPEPKRETRMKSTQADAAPEKKSTNKMVSPKQTDTRTKAESPKKHNTRNRTNLQDQKKASRHNSKSDTNRPKNASRDATKKDGKKTAALPDSEDVDETTTHATSTTQMRDAILDLFSTSLQVYHQFVAYSYERDSDAAGAAAQADFAGALQRTAGSTAQRKRAREKGVKSDAPARKRLR